MQKYAQKATPRLLFTQQVRTNSFISDALPDQV